MNRPGRGIDVLVGVGVALLMLEGVLMAVVAVMLTRRFGASIEWMHPELALPIAIMVVTAGFAIEALARRRSETAMVINAVSTLVVAVGVPAWFALIVLGVAGSSY